MAGVTDLRIHRLGFGLVVALVFAAVGVLALLNGLLSGSEELRLRLSAIFAGSAILLLCWVFGLRPTVAEEPARLLVRNPLSTSSVPWGAVTDVVLTDVVVVETTGEVPVRCFALPRRGRPSMSMGSSASLQPLPPKAQMEEAMNRNEEVVSRLRELAETLGPSAPGPVSRAWAVDGLGGLVVGLVLAVAAVVVR